MRAAANRESSILQQPRENGFVNGLQKTWTQVTVEMECDIHHYGGKFFQVWVASFAPSREPSLARKFRTAAAAATEPKPFYRR